MPSKGKRTKASANRYKDLVTLKGAQLLSMLDEIYETLRNETDESKVPGFTSLVKQLTSEKILKNETREVAQRVGFCVVEVYRLSEGIGFSDEVNQSILELVIRNLRTLECPSQNEVYLRTLDMFERVGQTPLLKAIVTLGDTGKEIAVSLFRTILTAIDSTFSSTPKKSKSKRSSRSKTDAVSQMTEEELSLHRDRVKRVAMDTIIAVLDLYKRVPDSLLDLLLVSLVPQTDSMKLPSQEMIEELLVIKKAKLASDVQKFCASILCAESSESESGEHVKVRRVFHNQMYSILMVLSEISFDYVIVLLPLVTRQLHMEDDQQRLQVVECLSVIFGNPRFDFMVQSPGPFEEYLNRYHDRAVCVRVAMVQASKSLIAAQPSSLSTLLPCLEERIKDTSWEVRQMTVDSLCTILNSSLREIPDRVFILLAERTLDKRSEVRKFAITGLVNILSIHMASIWNTGESDPIIEKKMGIIPVVLFRCYGVSDDEIRSRCSRLLNEILVSNCETEEAMARAYLWVFQELKKPHPLLQFQESETFGDTSMVLFKSLLLDWQKLQSLLSRLLLLGKEQKPLEQNQVTRILLQLSHLLSINTSRNGQPVIHTVNNNCFYALYELLLKDPSLRISLESLASPHNDITTIATAKKALISALQQSDTPRLATQLKSVYARFYLTIGSSDLLQVYLANLLQDRDIDITLQLLSTLIEVTPSVLLTLDLQLRLFAILQTLLRSITDQTEFHLRQSERQTCFLRCLASMSSAYRQWPYVFLDNNRDNIWNDKFTTELLPLLDCLLDNLPTFSNRDIRSVTTILSNFCRFIKSNDSDIDRLILVHYNDWLNEFLPSLTLHKTISQLRVDLCAVSMSFFLKSTTDQILRLDDEYANHLGIRCLVDSTLEMFSGSKDAMIIKDVDTCTLALQFLFIYARTIQRETELTRKILLFFVNSISSPSLFQEEQFQKKLLFCTLKLGAIKCYASYFTPEVFYQLALIIESFSEPTIVIPQIERFILFKQLPFKYISMIVPLWFCESESVQTQLIGSLRAVIRNQRRFVTAYQAETGVHSLSVPLYQLSPEYLLVYLLPLLSRSHPYSGLTTTPSKIQIRCIDVVLNELLQENPAGFGLLSALLASMAASQDRLKPKNVELSRLVTLTSQLLQKRLAVLKTVDVSYGEQVRLPAQYYQPRTRAENVPSTPKKRSEERPVEKGSSVKRTVDQNSIELAEGETVELTGVDSTSTEKRKRKRKQQSKDAPAAKKSKV